MDIPRQTKQRKRGLRVAVYAMAGVAVLLLIVIGLARLKPAAPSVERSTLWIEPVKRGSMLREVRGPGTLVAEDVRVVAAATEGRVERVLVQPGTEVGAGTVLLELTNPTLEQEAQDAEFAVRAGEADYNNLLTKLESERMSQQAVAAGVRAEYEQAKVQADTDEQLAKEGLIPALNLRMSRIKAAELANRYQIEQKRLEVGVRATQAQMAAQQARTAQLRALRDLKKTQLGSLRVLAGTSGVLQQMQVEVGQQIMPGTVLARVAEPQNLKAELKIAETQAKDIQLGQKASIDTRNGVVAGRVVRIDPSVQQGTVTVDVAPEGALPDGARPDLSIEGTIVQERLENILHVRRPPLGQPQSTISLFKLVGDGREAVRVQVKLGRGSVNTIEVLDGLSEGDQVILSDTSQWDAFERLRLN